MITNEIIEVDGQRWKIREARSLRDAENEIAMARVTGSIGGKSTLNQTLCGGGITVIADVIRINTDGTEAQPYQIAY